MSISLSTFDWSSMLDPDMAVIPHDVTFNVHDAETGKTEGIKAHRLLMSIVSPVFRDQFYGMTIVVILK